MRFMFNGREPAKIEYNKLIIKGHRLTGLHPRRQKQKKALYERDRQVASRRFVSLPTVNLRCGAGIGREKIYCHVSVATDSLFERPIHVWRLDFLSLLSSTQLSEPCWRHDLLNYWIPPEQLVVRAFTRPPFPLDWGMACETREIHRHFYIWRPLPAPNTRR